MPAASAGVGAVLILALVLGILFWRSFLPGYVHFSNDGPLGQQHTAAAHLPEAFHGTWSDANDIGSTGGAWALSFSALFRMFVGPVGYAKFLVPFALFVVAMGAWTFFRQLKLSPLAATLGALAAALNSTFFSTATWGVAPQEIAIGLDYFALALVISNTAETPLFLQLSRLALAGLCLGMNVMEAADIGAIFSIFIAAFIVFHALNQGSAGVAAKLGRGIGQVALVAVFAGFIATQTVVSLVGTQIQGIVGTGQDAQSKAQHWDWATEWSLPKAESLGLVIPGLYGYKMDTPNNMDPNFEEYYQGGNYWGGMGRDPNWDRYWAAGSQGDPPPGQFRQTSGTNYCGILVVLIALWAAAQSLRKGDTIFAGPQRRFLWFWSAIIVFSLLVAWGRFSIFYGILYQLPYFSTIRSPTKFLIVLSWALAIVFACGVDALSRRYLTSAPRNPAHPLAQFKSWWAGIGEFDRKWTFGCLALLGASLIGWLIYASQKPALIHYLQATGFPNQPGNLMANAIAAFSIRQAGYFVILLALAAGLLFLVLSGLLGGRRGKLGGLLLGLFLVVDMGRANLPYIIHWDYQQKYEIDTAHPGESTNPVINILKDQPWEHRVAQLPFPNPQGMELWEQLYTIEWVQHQFPYYNIQSLDLFQRPRLAADIEAYETAVYCHSGDTLTRLTRQWQLTNTRYLLGPAGFVDGLNSMLDSVQHRFQIAMRFNIGAKPGIAQPTKLEELTALPDTNGALALIEFTGALPRAKLYSTWRVSTNDTTTLQTLASPDFDPAQTVLVSTPQPGLAPAASNPNSGDVKIQSYAPTKIILAAQTTTPAVLLFNSKYDPDWTVTVDGQPAPLLRCNYIMRGVSLSPGTHIVIFRYYLPPALFYVTVAGYGLAILLSGVLIVGSRKPGEQTA